MQTVINTWDHIFLKAILISALNVNPENDAINHVY